MRAFIRVLFPLVVGGLVSCAAHQPVTHDPDTAKGRAAAYEYAKKDALEDDCFRGAGSNYAQAKEKYRQLFTNQGKSEAFIDGFFWGYKRARHDLWGVYCGY
jgi:hypothetical protein